IAAGEEVRDHVFAAIGCKGEVAGFQRDIEGAPYQRSTGTQGPRPGNDAAPEAHVDAGLEAVQPALLYQIEAELAEAERRPVVAEARPQYQVEADIGVARSIAVTILQAKIRHAKEDKSEQILVGVQRWRHDLLEHVHGRAPVGITHRRQVNERLDRSAP